MKVLVTSACGSHTVKDVDTEVDRRKATTEKDGFVDLDRFMRTGQCSEEGFNHFFTQLVDLPIFG
jgi:hypothetical protein